MPNHWFLLAASGFIFTRWVGLLIRQPMALSLSGKPELFLKILSGDAFIKINGKPYVQNHGLFNNNGDLIKGLLPGDYQIEISKKIPALGGKI